MEILVRVSESPVSMITEDERDMDNSNVPEVTRLQKEMSVTVSPLVPAQLVQAGVLLALMTPAEALPQVTDSRVVVLEGLAVPAEPGSPIAKAI
jgi:hypothetical protein